MVLVSEVHQVLVSDTRRDRMRREDDVCLLSSEAVQFLSPRRTPVAYSNQIKEDARNGRGLLVVIMNETPPLPEEGGARRTPIYGGYIILSVLPSHKLNLYPNIPLIDRTKIKKLRIHV